MEYKDLIPQKPPAGLINYLCEKEHKFQDGIITYRKISMAEANDWLNIESCAADLRRGRTTKNALLWCSECERTMLAEYISASRSCHPLPSGVCITDENHPEGAEFQDGHNIGCPCCGKKVKLRSMNAMRGGRTEQCMVTVPTVEQGRLVLTKWEVERHIEKEYQKWSCSAFEAFIVDGHKIHRLVHYRKFFTTYEWMRDWEEPQKFRDTMGCPYFYMDDLPDLDGTELENAKLWEFARQTYEKNLFYPVAYIRLYKKRPAAENLVTAGMGFLLGEALKEDCAGAYTWCGDTSMRAPRLAWMNWKEAKPHKILGLTKDQLREAKRAGWGMKQLRFWNEHREKISFRDTLIVLDDMSEYEAKELMEEGIPAVKAARYLKKQRAKWYTLKDYWRMAEKLDMDLRQSVVRWPPNLMTAHDRAAAAIKIEKSRELQERFAEMTRRCQDLAWEHDGICIRPAESVEELIKEGQTLHHCVGGYGEAHANGKIILFIRHTRRPERSWYTLNVDIYTKTILQNHGYRNECLPNGKYLAIPKPVQDFVNLWQQQVLEPWKPEKPKSQKKLKNTPAEHAA